MNTPQNTVNALVLLKADHQRVRDLFVQAQQSESIEQKRDVFQTIRDELELHSHIEETIFYPSFAQYRDLEEILDRSYEEHSEVKDLLIELSDLSDLADSADEEQFEDTLDELMENVEHHVQEEEEELFPQIEGRMDEEKLERLGELLLEAKHRGESQAA